MPLTPKDPVDSKGSMEKLNASTSTLDVPEIRTRGSSKAGSPSTSRPVSPSQLNRALSELDLKPSGFSSDSAHTAGQEAMQTALPHVLNLRVENQFMLLTALEELKGTIPAQPSSVAELDDLKDQVEELVTTFQAEHSALLNEWPSSREALLHPYLQKNAALQMRRSSSALRRTIAKGKATLAQATHPPPAQTERPAPEVRHKLPEITLPKFDGDYHRWPSFIEYFSVLIIKNHRLTDVQRLHYLRGCLKGAPLELISSLPLNEASFQESLALLRRRYDNKRLLVQAQLDRLFTLKDVKSKDAASLSKLISTLMEVSSSLNSMGIENLSQLLITSIGLRHLDRASKEAWETSLGESIELPTLDQFERFLSARARALERVESSTAPSNPSSTPSSAQPLKRGATKASTSSTLMASATNSAPLSRTDQFLRRETSHNCDYCKEAHYIVQCSKFRGLTPLERYEIVKSHRLCVNCLGRHSLSSCRSSSSCKDVGSVVELNSFSAQLHNPASAHLCSTLLCTALARVITPLTQLQIRILLDTGSEISLVSDSLVRQLNLPRYHSSLLIKGIDGVSSISTSGSVQLKLQSIHSTEQICMNVHVLRKLKARIQTKSVSAPADHAFHGMDLADPQFHLNRSVDLLIGVDYFGKIIRPKIKHFVSNSLTAQLTMFGWVLFGPVHSTSNKSRSICSISSSSDSSLNELLSKFWIQEEVPSSSSSTLTPDEEECELHFQTTHSRDSAGRYIVRLPLKLNPLKLGSSQLTASRCIERLSRKFNKNDQYKQLYCTFMQEYEELEHMQKVSESMVNGAMTLAHDAQASGGLRVAPEASAPPSGSSPHYYLPHHGVLRPDSSTTKLRVVFNGSSPSSNGASINQLMHTGANLLLNISDVLLWIRIHKYIFSTDITKMYRQIKVHPNDWDLQRILWFDNELNIVPYHLTTVTYGTRAAPYLATRVLIQLVKDEGHQFPLAVPPLTHGRYVDDIFGGADSISQLSQIAQQVQGLCQAGGFPLAKWHANSHCLFEENPSFTQDKSTVSFDDCEAKLLGIKWIPSSDVFTFSSKLSSNSHVHSKRRILSEVAQIFDPLGFLTPVTIRAKIFLQELWSLQLTWDDPLPELISAKWLEIRSQLHSLASVSVPRWMGTKENAHVELHGFADASQFAMGAAVYLLIRSPSREAKPILVCAKSKVAPLKKLTIPRLELTAALILAKLVSHLKSTLKLKIDDTHLWTDSKVTLMWINSHPSRWKDYVRNRVTQIHDLCANCVWRHVPGVENPADCASRGISAQQLITHQLWWTGPSWLALNINQWPVQAQISSDLTNAEARPGVTLLSRSTGPTYNWDLIFKYSSLHKLIGVTAQCLKFIRLATHSPNSSALLTITLMTDARNFWVKATQAAYFSSEIRSISRGSNLPSDHALARLTAFIDGTGILRIGGRLKEMHISYEEKHPAILPRHSPLTQLIIDEAHRSTLHGGTQLTLSRIRQAYWIIGGRAPVKSHILRCVKCARERGIRAQQLMGQLPLARISPSQAFAHTGVDYAGPIFLTAWKGRGSKSVKGWICVFVCFATSAVHLEVVSDYSSDGFLAAFRRFTARRGQPTTIYSDCGTNFVGAETELKNLFTASTAHHQKLSSKFTHQGISWKFNAPSTPHMGGKWESAVKSIKFHLKRTTANTLLTYEEYSTLLAQIEAVLNSRPLEPLSDDPDDVSALTPGHFLIGSALNTVPEPSLLDLKTSRLVRWQAIQQKVQQFWSLWSAHHLQRQQSISKWHHPSNQLKIGSLVLLTDERSPPSKWPLARIIELIPGRDGLVRIVKLKTATTTLTRPVVKLAPLPSWINITVDGGEHVGK